MPAPKGPRHPPTDRVFAAAFGRYEASRPAGHPASEVLVGRERERARILDWLLVHGSRGAYLITGYRGVGKTSFLNFSLQRYSEDVYGRYLQARVGRALFWDRIVITLVITVALLIPLLAGQLAHTLAAFATQDQLFAARPARLLALALLAPAFLTACYPLVYSRRLLRTAAGISRTARRDIGLLYVACLLVLHQGAFASPIAGIALFAALLSWTFFVGRAFSVTVENSLARDPSSEGFSITTGAARRFSSGLLLLGGTILLLLPRFIPDEERCLIKTYLASAGMLTALGFVVRSADARGLARFLIATQPHQRRLIEAQGRVAWGNTWMGLGSVLLLVLFNYDSGARMMVLAGAAATLGAFTYCVRENMRSWRDPHGAEPVWYAFHPRPRALIGLKGVFAFAIGVQLVPPLAKEYLGKLILQLVPVGKLLQLLPAPVEALLRAPDYAMFGADAYLLGAPRQAGAAPAFRGFDPPLDELAWLSLAVTFVLCLMYLENDWIVRRHDRARRDDAYDPERWRASPSSASQELGFGGAESRMQLLHLNRELIKATNFYWLYHTWLPLLTVKVNLGFDNLSHTQVVTAMLVGLRNEYHRTFVSWKSRLGLLFRLASCTLLSIVAVMLGSWLAQAVTPGSDESDWLHLLASHKEIPDARCAATEPCMHLLSYLLAYSHGPIPIYGYQLAILLALLLLLAGLTRRARGLHYQVTYARLNAVLASLSSNVRVKESAGRAAISRWNLTFSGAESSSEAETPRQDPRTIEQAFLDVLRDVITPHIPLPVSGHLLSLPAPQLTFVFDELDKIGTASANMLDDVPLVHDAGQAQSAGAATADRERSRRVHRLLADMKNLLSVAPARFIFVGGRDLHDEWLADRSARQPLLSNIFDAEIYLPTLLTDTIVEGTGGSDMSSSVHALLNARLARNLQLHSLWEKGKRKPFLSPVGPNDHFFVQTPNFRGPLSLAQTPPTGAAEPTLDLSTWNLYDVDANSPAVPWSGDFLQKFSEYLAFRSRGNPKRVDALLEALVRPSGRVIRDPFLRWSRFDCQHVLRFGRSQRVYIEFVAEIFRRLARLVGVRAAHGEDKNVRAAFYLADFLMKFHRRAFSWTSLERIDEVLHVHRAPDLRGLLSELVLDWSQSFVQPIVNGMYTFRFRSDVAAEIRNISRLSESEMAALNFTLDESQSIKIELQRRADRLAQRGKHEALAETRAALGELSDFDEDYEEARSHYAAAIELLDAQIKRAEETGLLARSARDGQQPIPLRRHAEWGALRLRLMLQIGLTYERSRNYEQALAEYRNALTLSRALWFDMLDAYARDDAAPSVAQSSVAPPDAAQARQPLRPEQVEGKHRIDTLKHLHIVYQPLFAVAWMGEKAASGIDTSLTAVEEGLWEIRQRLPFVRLPGVLLSRGPVRATHANFALTTADLHHNAGNLYFFKGRHTIDASPTRGYLDRAYYHYAVALHEVRRSHSHRRESARHKLIPFESEAFRGQSPIPGDILPDATLRRVTCAAFGLANVWLAQVSLEGLIWHARDDGRGHKSVRAILTELTHLEPTFVAWLASQPHTEATAGQARGSWLPRPRLLGWQPPRQPLRRFRSAPPRAEPSELERFVGCWMGTDPGPPRMRTARPGSGEAGPKETRVVRLGGLENDLERVLGYVRFSALAARLLFSGGHSEEAANEWLRLAAGIECLLTALEAYAVLDGRGEGDGDGTLHEVSAFLIQQATAALEQAEHCLTFRQSERVLRYDLIVPAHGKRLVRAVALAAVRHEQRLQRAQSTTPARTPSPELRSLYALAQRWAIYAKRLEPNAALAPCESREPSTVEIERALVEGLSASLVSSAYPVLNHLMSQRALLFHYVLQRLVQRRCGKTPDPPEPAYDELIHELVRMDQEFNSTWHFTPFHAGTVLALCAIEREGTQYDHLRREGERRLVRSQHMYTSRAAYYESITHLYYLDDDFNDRCTQVRHAMQMMGSDLTALLVSYLRDRRAPPKLSVSSTKSTPPEAERRRGPARTEAQPTLGLD